MMAHQPPTKQAVLTLKQLLHTKLTRNCFSKTSNPICMHKLVAASSHICVWEREVESVCLWPAGSAVFIQHVIALKLNEYITLCLCWAPTWHPIFIMLSELGPLILVSWRRIICIKRGVKWERELSHWWKPPQGFKRPEITEWAETLLSWFDSWNNHQRD